MCGGGGRWGSIHIMYLWYIQTTLLRPVISVDWLELGVEAIQHSKSIDGSSAAPELSTFFTHLEELYSCREEKACECVFVCVHVHVYVCAHCAMFTIPSVG